MTQGRLEVTVHERMPEEGAHPSSCTATGMSGITCEPRQSPATKWPSAITHLETIRGSQVTLERIFSSGVHWGPVHQGIGDTLCNLA